MPTLKLTSLQCIRKHDLTGSDEPEIQVNNDTVWEGVMNKGETEILTGNRTPEIPFSTTLSVRLVETTDGVNRGIGPTHTVHSYTTNNGLAVFKTSGTHYELKYKVV